MSNEIGQKLKHLRTSKKLSQQEVSEKVGITRSTISNYEVGRRTPHLKDLQKFAKAFGVGLDYFDISPTDEVFDLLARAKKVFGDKKVSKKSKDELYREFMKLYLTMKGDLK